jgi:hypothetical protein
VLTNARGGLWGLTSMGLEHPPLVRATGVEAAVARLQGLQPLMSRAKIQTNLLWTCPMNPHLMYIWCDVYLFIYGSWPADESSGLRILTFLI